MGTSQELSNRPGLAGLGEYVRASVPHGGRRGGTKYTLIPCYIKDIGQ